MDFKAFDDQMALVQQNLAQTQADFAALQAKIGANEQAELDQRTQALTTVNQEVGQLDAAIAGTKV